MAAVHLTFDNGPHPTYTPQILQTLARRGLQATFFVLGQHLATAEGRALAEQIRDAGHRLANHTYTHETPLGVDPRPDAVEQELTRTQALLDPIWDGPKWFRPFGGGGHLGDHLLSPAAVEWLAAGGHTCVLWNAVPGDWKDPDGWVDTAMGQIAALDHAVVVLHDIVAATAEHLDGFIARLIEAGHTFTDDWPAEVLPIIAGEVQPGIERYVGVPAA